MQAVVKTFSTSSDSTHCRRRSSVSFTVTAASMNLLLVVLSSLTAANGFLIPHRKSVAPDDIEVHPVAAESLRNVAFRDALTANEPPSSSVQCGAPSALSLLGASDTQSTNWPWFVSIRAENSPLCGGTLIGERWVLTAVECARRLVSANYKVAVIGRRGSAESDQFSQTIPIETVMAENDNVAGLALLTLAEVVSFNSGVLPVCLPRSLQIVPTGRICWSTGWTEDGLTQTLVTKVDGEMCGSRRHHPHQNSYRRRDTTTTTDNTSICALTVDREHPCQVESPGSPMVCLEDGRWVLFGISGDDDDVCATEVSGTRVFKSVPAKVDWVSRHMHVQ